jgi:hypothetical protein
MIHQHLQCGAAQSQVQHLGAFVCTTGAAAGYQTATKRLTFILSLGKPHCYKDISCLTNWNFTL